MIKVRSGVDCYARICADLHNTVVSPNTCVSGMWVELGSQGQTVTQITKTAF